MSNGNGLIYLHNHENYNILKELSEVDGVLYYKGLPILSGNFEDIIKEYTEEEIQEMIISLWKSLGENVEFENGTIKVPIESGGDTSDNGES